MSNTNVNVTMKAAELKAIADQYGFSYEGVNFRSSTQKETFAQQLQDYIDNNDEQQITIVEVTQPDIKGEVTSLLESLHFYSSKPSDIRNYICYSLFSFNSSCKEDMSARGNSKDFWQHALTWLKKYTSKKDTQAQAQAELDEYISEQADAVAPEPELTTVEEIRNAGLSLKVRNGHYSVEADMGLLYAGDFDGMITWWQRPTNPRRQPTTVSEPEADNSEQADAVAPEPELTRQQMITALSSYYGISGNEYSNCNDLDVAFSYRLAQGNDDWSDRTTVSEPLPIHDSPEFNSEPTEYELYEREHDDVKFLYSVFDMNDVRSLGFGRTNIHRKQWHRTVRRRANRFFRELALAA